MKPYYYVYRVGNGNSNVKHTTLESAQKEAERICNQHPGTTFEILKCVASVRCTQASTFWMDGEEPPEKPRYRTLEDGELIAEGDEFSHPEEGWKRHTIGIGDVMSNGAYLPTRRPL